MDCRACCASGARPVRTPPWTGAVAEREPALWATLHALRGARAPIRDFVKTPPSLQTLIDEGVIDDVMRPLKSGKEASVYVVRCGDDIRCAKVYKDMAHRSFQKRVQYQEGRKSRGSRESRAVATGSRYGRRQQETEWKNAEVDALYQLRAAGVRVPEDIALAGFDDIPLARYVHPGLTTMRVDIAALGGRALRALLARLGDPELPATTERLEVELVVRQSCGSRPRI